MGWKICIQTSQVDPCLPVTKILIMNITCKLVSMWQC